MESLKLCIVVPCYNEEKRLDQEAYKLFFEKNPHINFLFVNDGSKDKTLEILQKLAYQYPQVSVLDLEKNCGKALAVRAGCLKAQAGGHGHIGYWDADLATPLEEINHFVEVLKSHPELEVVIGSRLKRLGAHIKRKFSRHLIGRFFATLASLILELKVYDTQCGAKIFSQAIVKEIFKQEFVSYWIFDVELLFRIKMTDAFKKNNNCILELPLYYWMDKSGSKLKFTDFLKAPFELLSIFIEYRLKSHKV